MSSWDAHETYLGDGLYARYDAAQMIVLRAPRNSDNHWVGLEPQVFVGLIQFAHKIGWSKLIERGAPRPAEEE
jgi:hypothetical protein